jgi:hypothetical protein
LERRDVHQRSSVKNRKRRSGLYVHDGLIAGGVEMPGQVVDVGSEKPPNARRVQAIALDQEGVK